MLANPTVDPCTMDLSSMFVNATTTEMEKLQQVFCTVNLTVLFDEIRRELDVTFLGPMRVSIAYVVKYSSVRYIPIYSSYTCIFSLSLIMSYG